MPAQRSATLSRLLSIVIFHLHASLHSFQPLQRSKHPTTAVSYAGTCGAARMSVAQVTTCRSAWPQLEPAASSWHGKSAPLSAAGAEQVNLMSSLVSRTVCQ